MHSLLKTMGHRFDHIIIDSPPAISFTDAAILSTLVDGVLIVVRESKSSRRMVSRVKQQLLDLGANIYGVILNDAKTTQTDYYYDGHYKSSPKTFEMVETHMVGHSIQTKAWINIESSEIEQAFKKFRREVN
jgi:Mrp family chromosome partitioning ATPase